VSDFPVIPVPMPNVSERQPRLEGAIDKYWLDLPNIGRSLLKADLRGAWVEKVAATLAERIGLPVVGYELAERSDGLKMIASPSFLLDGAREIPGEELLIDALGENYLYTPDAILSVLDNLDIALPSRYQSPETVSTASDLLAGYLIYDSWIGNIDRHSRNWGIQRTLDGRRELLPTFDHGLSLGVRMPEDKLPLDIASFSGDCRCSIQGEVGGALSMNGLARRLLELKPEAAGCWIDRIASIDRATIEEVFERMPQGWVDDIRQEFAIDFLDASRDRLMVMSSRAEEPSVIVPTRGSSEPAVIVPTRRSNSPSPVEIERNDDFDLSM
jgi:hypothetical protein